MSGCRADLVRGVDSGSSDTGTRRAPVPLRFPWDVSRWAGPQVCRKPYKHILGVFHRQMVHGELKDTSFLTWFFLERALQYGEISSVSLLREAGGRLRIGQDSAPRAVTADHRRLQSFLKSRLSPETAGNHQDSRVVMAHVKESGESNRGLHVWETCS